MTERSYRRRPDGILEIRPRARPVDELLRSIAVGLGGIAVVITVAAAVGWSADPVRPYHTSGTLSVCWNWSAGVPTGCWTR